MIKKIVGTVAFGLSMAVLASSAQAYKINVSGWKGGSYNSKSTGRFSHCVVSAKYKRGDRLLMSINRKYVFSLGVADNRWDLRKGAKYSVTLRVDRRRRFVRTAIAVSSRQLVVRINDRATFFKMVKSGRTLWIDANGLNRGYSLRGTSRALNATLRCVKRKLRYASDDGYDQPRAIDEPKGVEGGTNKRLERRKKGLESGRKGLESGRKGLENGETTTTPQRFASVNRKKPRQKSRKVANGMSDQRALIHTINLLSDAGISGYKLLEKNPFKSAGYQVAWRYSKGRRGALATFKNRKKDFVDTQTSKLLGSDAKACKGQFASGFRKSDSSKKWSGRRLFTVCSNSSTGNDFTIHYSIGLQPSGIATIVATHLNSEGLSNGETDDSEQIDQSIYKSATFRNIGK